MADTLALFNEQPPMELLQRAYDENGVTTFVEYEKMHSLSIRGKTFKIIMDKDTQVDILRDGFPAPFAHLLIIDYSPDRSKLYFEGGYDSAVEKRPVCWSNNGKTPSSHVPIENRQSDACKGCPRNEKGSSGNAKSKACGDTRRMAVFVGLEDGSWSEKPALLRLPVTSDYDEDRDGVFSAKGRFAFRQYADLLGKKEVESGGKKVKGVAVQSVVAQVSFDNTEFPRIKFEPKRYVTPAEYELIATAKDTDLVKRMIGGDEFQGIKADTTAPAVEEVKVNSVTLSSKSTEVVDAEIEALGI